MNSEEKKQVSAEEQLKARYKEKLYRVSMTVPVDDDHEEAFSYHFRRPSIPAYDRYIKTASKAGITKASRAFMLDCVVDEDRERLAGDMEENPGIALMIGNRLTDIMGLTDTVNLKRL